MFDQNTSVVIKATKYEIDTFASQCKLLETTRSPYILMHKMSNIVFRIRKVI